MNLVVDLLYAAARPEDRRVSAAEPARRAGCGPGAAVRVDALRADAVLAAGARSRRWSCSAVVVVALFDEQIAPTGPNEVDIANRLLPPGPGHPFGTDDLGRDVLSRVVLGAEVSLQVGAVAVGFALVCGVLVGLLAGFYGRWVDDRAHAPDGRPVRVPGDAAGHRGPRRPAGRGRPTR